MTIKPDRSVTFERFSESMSYDADTGVITWLRVNRRPHLVGKEAGSIAVIEGIAYRVIRLDGRSYMAHQFAWLAMTGAWPEQLIDHADGDGLNNAWTNLRAATTSQNAMNGRLARNNTTGFKGVTFNKRRGKFQSSLRKDGRLTYLGLFDTAEEAHEAYKAAAQELFGQFFRAA